MACARCMATLPWISFDRSPRASDFVVRRRQTPWNAPRESSGSMLVCSNRESCRNMKVTPSLGVAFSVPRESMGVANASVSIASRLVSAVLTFEPTSICGIANFWFMPQDWMVGERSDALRRAQGTLPADGSISCQFQVCRHTFARSCFGCMGLSLPINRSGRRG